MVKVVIVNGKPGCGKTTFEQMCQEHCMKNTVVHIISSVDYVKECARKIGWDGKKDFWGRRFLSDLKNILTLYDDSPYLKVVHEINRYKNDSKLHIFLVDVRESMEIGRYVDDFKATTILIRRPESEEQKVSNFSDYLVEDYVYDYVIENCGNLEQLRMSAETMMERFRKGE